MKIRLNPIVKKDLQVTARSMRLSWGLFVYEAVLTLTFLLALAVIREEAESYYSDSNIYQYLIYLFPVLAIVQVCIVTLIVPIITASAISGEKERQTFDIMLTTCMSPLSIVLGKVASAVIRILFFVMAGLPVMSLSFVVGGLEWRNLFYFIFTIILLSVFSGSIGIFCSSICRKSISAVVLSYIFYFIIYILTFVPALIKELFANKGVGEMMLLWLINPIIFFEEFFMQIMTGESFFSGHFEKDDVGFLTYQLATGKTWMILSGVCIAALSVLFILAAAWKVNPMHTSSGRRVRKR